MELDWVTVRSACVLASLFQKLKLELAADVKKRNALRPDPAGHQFEVSTVNGSVSVSQIQWPRGTSVNSVTFELRETSIAVLDSTGTLMFAVGLTINNQGECCYKIGCQEYDSWQLRKRALEPLFFESHLPMA
jgi:hypothetical protein